MYKLIKSKRKTISVEISPEAEVIVRAPARIKQADIDRFLEVHRIWIEKHIELQKQRIINSEPEPTPEQIAELKKAAKELLPQRVEHFACIMGVKPTSIKITSARKRLGSCSSKGGLCFSYRLTTYDPEVIDYVAVHELAHIKEFNHSKRFYDLVKIYCPDYERIEKIIKRRG